MSQCIDKGRDPAIGDRIDMGIGPAIIDRIDLGIGEGRDLPMDPRTRNT
jgi:hypothetical protein